MKAHANFAMVSLATAKVRRVAENNCQYFLDNPFSPD